MFYAFYIVGAIVSALQALINWFLIGCIRKKHVLKQINDDIYPVYWGLNMAHSESRLINAWIRIGHLEGVQRWHPVSTSSAKLQID